ncbi:vacuolar protein sorting-associated protein [Salix suchowensis]|nr:vacuolar protein sorting-associated protein [Salix suchowensis]
MFHTHPDPVSSFYAFEECYGNDSGIDDFLTKFWDCWKGRAWEIGNDSGGGPGYGSFSGSSGGLYSSNGSLSLMGVAGILRKEKEMWESTDKSIQEAFQDLNALMDLLQACSLWEKFDVPVMLRKFDSGAIVIQNKSHSDEEVFARIKNLVSKPEVLWTGINASDAAMTMVIASAMAKKPSSLKIFGRFLLCRDISPDGFCFFINPFPEINFDDVHRVKDHGIYSLWIKRVEKPQGYGLVLPYLKKRASSGPLSTRQSSKYHVYVNT